MKASIVDLRYKSKEVLRALERNEEVRVLHRGKEKGRIVPAGRDAARAKTAEHPFFNSATTDESPAATVDRLRGPRYPS